LPSALRAEACKDDRVQDVTAVVSRVNNGDGTASLTITMNVLLVDENEAFSVAFAVAGSTMTFEGALP
jgi:hypothetical protein